MVRYSIVPRQSVRSNGHKESSESKIQKGTNRKVTNTRPTIIRKRKILFYMHFGPDLKIMMTTLTINIMMMVGMHMNMMKLIMLILMIFLENYVFVHLVRECFN